MKDGYSSRREFLEAQFRVENVRQELIANEGDIDSARKSLDEARSGLAQSDAETANRLVEKRKDAARELAEIRQQLAKQSDRASIFARRSMPLYSISPSAMSARWSIPVT